MQQKNMLTTWSQLNGFPKRMFVEAIHDDLEGFRIILKDLENNICIRVSFKAALSYRNTDESYMLQLWNNIPKENKDGIFYLIINSEYIDFFNEMTYGLYKDKEIKHYAIYSDADCIDVISIEDPVVTILD